MPVPDDVLVPGLGPGQSQGRWRNHGEVTDEFTEARDEAELWSYEDPDVDGLCTILPRWTDDSNFTEAGLVGVICMSRTTGKVCFWDSRNGVPMARNVAHPIESFVGGQDLQANEQGDCSDCHAGQNPWVVHPDRAAFIDLANTRVLNPAVWPMPIVPVAGPGQQQYPGNAGPFPFQAFG
ncbi:MAG: hypothetical protein AAGA56_17845, partial [Myxococcota bacterium]